MPSASALPPPKTTPQQISPSLTRKIDIPAFLDYISPSLLKFQLGQTKAIHEGSIHPELRIINGEVHPVLETEEALQFIVSLYQQMHEKLNNVLERRKSDRKFIDEQTTACNEENLLMERRYKSPQYKTIIGQKDHENRVVVGPYLGGEHIREARGAPVRDIPPYLQNEHITLFGPPDTAKLSINAMNAIHRSVSDEPQIISQLVNESKLVPKWGADDEDSKTPLRDELLIAAQNLNECYNGTLEFTDPQTNRVYKLQKERTSLPIKRFPGLALPSMSHFVNGSPLPLHLYDFALHIFHQWHRPEALSFYVPKLENEEEAAYLRSLIMSAELLIKQLHPQYKIGSVSILVVLENPRAIFRLNEIMDNLHPYFVGASLGWHDYLASTARLFKEDSQYRIPVKADPNIVIHHIKESHIVLSKVVGERGGIRIGGMYGVIPSTRATLSSPSFQVCMVGYIKDVTIQLKRGLDGFWVAHPDFVRIGVALVEAWNKFEEDPKDSTLEQVVRALVLDKDQQEHVLQFIRATDVEGLNPSDPLYERALLAADVEDSKMIQNNDPNEIRYNIFQALQYLADWLSGNGCVALPATISGVNVRIMDDLATTERSRWEVWHELYHKRFELDQFLEILHEEVSFIKNDLTQDNKVVQVKWDGRTAKWYPSAINLLIILMTSKNPVEFATELLLPFTVDAVRASDDPWEKVMELEHLHKDRDENNGELDQESDQDDNAPQDNDKKDPSNHANNPKTHLSPCENPDSKFYIPPYIQYFNAYFECCPNRILADSLARMVFYNSVEAKRRINELDGTELLRMREYMLTPIADVRASDTLSLESTPEEVRAFVTKKVDSCHVHQDQTLHAKIQQLLVQTKVAGVSISILNGLEDGDIQNITAGYANKETGEPVTPSTYFEMASLSKTIAAAFALEYFREKGLSLEKTCVNDLLTNYNSPFRLRIKEGLPNEWASEVTLRHLLNHTGLGMHYVYGIPLSEPTPCILDLLNGNEKYGYEPIEVFKQPGTQFHYSGGAFLVLHHLLEIIENKPIEDIFRPFLDELGMQEFTFHQQNLPDRVYANGYNVDGSIMNAPHGRLQFPPLAAGGLGAPRALANFLHHLTVAYHNTAGSSLLSHETAIEMLYYQDFGSMEFMGCGMGLGIFVAEAGPNRFALHQAANDGFRGMYCHCVEGPDVGKGFVIISNSDNNAVWFNSYVAQQLLIRLHIEGIDFSKFHTDFDPSGMKQEDIVNFGYKELVFNAFIEDLPEAITIRGAKDVLAGFNLALDGKITYVTNQRFARGSNMLSSYQPAFDPNGFGRQGKIMDSWETGRHSLRGHDLLKFDLKRSTNVSFVAVSTEFHDGNHSEFVELEAFDDITQEWIQLLPKSQLFGHSVHKFAISSDNGLNQRTFSKICVHNIPDGGISRLALYNETLPSSEQNAFKKFSVTRCNSDIPPVKKESIKYSYPQYEEICSNWRTVESGKEIDVANACYGGRVIFATNERFGPASSVVAPFKARGMFDGFETARSRIPGHIDYIVVQLAAPSKLDRIEVEFTYFVNNNPRFITVYGYDADDDEYLLVHKMNVKPYAGNTLVVIPINNDRYTHRVKIVSDPDGGYNRVRFFSRDFERPLAFSARGNTQ
uniref:malate synthase n=1 Tax=Percolomonas cosmopolitus TaxID=63605 RepID=A0A7S1PIM5_9EUKA|eukprot:CAMPEP_0117449468 /NCGR_PEP_ID=MMETSP0759-20121206/7961_1 /TAXON_ID=63605 /ORGANISM="Percolomonas cosmopolitus, Strain WS" /LENGTH=1619 /DNA_ID=CAMNT_0005241945 /DNA_START=146 /DNA_END=5005 /DNA_ORIENTATION=+